MYLRMTLLAYLPHMSWKFLLIVGPLVVVVGKTAWNLLLEFVVVGLPPARVGEELDEL